MKRAVIILMLVIFGWGLNGCDDENPQYDRYIAIYLNSNLPDTVDVDSRIKYQILYTAQNACYLFPQFEFYSVSNNFYHTVWIVPENNVGCQTEPKTDSTSRFITLSLVGKNFFYFYSAFDTVIKEVVVIP